MPSKSARRVEQTSLSSVMTAQEGFVPEAAKFATSPSVILEIVGCLSLSIFGQTYLRTH
jgi:hypothetical protein